MIMSKSETDTITRTYFKRLNKALRALSRSQRQQIVKGIEEHVVAARAELDSPSSESIQAMLDRIGRPEEIAEEALEANQLAPAERPSAVRAGIILLPVAGVLLAIELVCGVAGVLHYISKTGITQKRRELTLLFFVVVGAIGPIAVSLFVFDIVRIGLSRKNRMALAGFVGATVAGIAVLLFLPSIIAHNIILSVAKL
jgi:uncharacterized membrane protein